MFHKMPFILLFIALAVLLINPYLSLEIQQICYATSITIKSLIVFLLPFIIFGLLFKTMVSLSHRATSAIMLILVLVCCSNTASTFFSHYVGEWIYHFDLSLIQPKNKQELTPFWSWSLPKLIANDKAMFAGIILGILLGITKPTIANKIAVKLDYLIGKLLEMIALCIPLFVAGFIVKLQYDGVIQLIMKDYSMIFIVIALTQVTYILLAYFVLNSFSPLKTLQNLKNMLPAAIAGFSAMSSAAAMPLTLAGVQRSTNNQDLARSVIPATVNIHLIGDCIAIPIFAYAVMKSFGISEPNLFSYLIFVGYFVLAKFSVAAVPGGGIIVMLPILENHLGFNNQMLSLVTALYILFDPVITTANVLGNGAFAKLADKLLLTTPKKCPA